MFRRSALFALSISAAVGLAAGSARAADDGYDNVFSSVLTAVGLLKADRSPEIDYRERAPLVLPPKMALAKPVAEGTAHSAAWPQDPDVLRRRRESEEARAPSLRSLGNPHEGVSKEELMKGRVAAVNGGDIPESAARRAACGNEGNQRNCALLTPDELRAIDERYKAAGLGDKPEVVAGEEPDRQYLTQPPKGYLKATRTVKATAEAPKTAVDLSNPLSTLLGHHSDDTE